MTIPQLSRYVFDYGGPVSMVSGFVHVLAFVLMGRMYRTKEQEMARRGRDEDMAMRGVWLIVVGTVLCIGAAIRHAWHMC